MESRLVMYNTDKTFVQINDYNYVGNPIRGPIFITPGPIPVPSSTNAPISGTYTYVADPLDNTHYILTYYGTNSSVIGRDDLYFQSPTSGTAFLPPPSGASLSPPETTFQISSAQSTNGGANISTRAQLASGANIIGGFVVNSSGPRWVLLRGVGATLGGFNVSGTVSNPSFTLYDSTGNSMESSTVWSTDPNLLLGFQEIFAAAGAFQLKSGSDEGVMLVQLQPGAYTAVARASNAGQILLEVYILSY